MKVLVLANLDIGLYRFRKELLERLLADGNTVYISLPKGDLIPELEKLGCVYIRTEFNRRGMNPFADIKLMKKYASIVKSVKPDVVLTYTIKPNIYGGMVCASKRVPYICNVTGIGASISNGGILSGVCLELYKRGLRGAACVFFQNESNRELFINSGIVKGRRRLIPGSGVNLSDNRFEEYPDDRDGITILFVGRVMRDKGICELTEAAEMVKAKHPNVKFKAIGFVEKEYEAEIRDTHNGAVEFLGHRDNVHDYMKSCHAVILPSYHEGISNVLLEAAATGRPILASDIPGCRETFDEVVSGIGFERKNAKSAADCIERFLELSNEQRAEMGLAGRRKMEQCYDRQIVIEAYIQEINRCARGI